MMNVDAARQLSRDIKEIFKRLDDLETNPVSITGGAVPAPVAQYDHLEADATPAWTRVVSLTLANDAFLNLGPAGGALEYDAANAHVQVTGVPWHITPQVGVGVEPLGLVSLLGAQNPLSDLNDEIDYHLNIRRNSNTIGSGAGISFGVDTGSDVGAAIIHERTAANSQGHLRFYTQQGAVGADPVLAQSLLDSGNAQFEFDVNLVTGRGIIHADGVAAGQYLRADGTRYIPASIAAGDLPAHTHADAAEGGATLSATAYNAAATVSAIFTHSANLVLDDGVGDSPLLSFVGGSNDDTISFFLEDDATADDSDLILKLADASGDSEFQIRTSTGATRFSVDSLGIVTASNNAVIAGQIHVGTTPGGRIAEDGSNDLGITAWSEGNDLYFQTWPGGGAITTRLTITSAGNILLAPGATLDLNGIADALILDTDADTTISAPTDDQIDIEIAGADDFTFTANSFNVLTDSSIYLSEHMYHLGDTNTYLQFNTDRARCYAGGILMWDAYETTTDYLNLHAGLVGINNAGLNSTYQTIGLTIDQSTNDDEALAIQSGTDVAHGMTTLAFTSTYFTVDKQAAAAGGARLSGYTTTQAGMALVSNFTTDATTHGAAAAGAFYITARKKSGTTFGNIASGQNILNIRGRIGGANRNVAIFAEDGDLYLDTVVNENAWDEHDDLALLHGLRASLVPDGHALQRRFGQWVDYARPILERTGVVTYNDDGHHFVATKKLQMLTVDALRQVAERAFERIEMLEQRIGVLENGTK